MGEDLRKCAQESLYELLWITATTKAAKVVKEGQGTASKQVGAMRQKLCTRRSKMGKIEISETLLAHIQVYYTWI
jgi:hypothetical protein